MIIPYHYHLIGFICYALIDIKSNLTLEISKGCPKNHIFLDFSLNNASFIFAYHKYRLFMLTLF